jgi:hypothetical protein
MNASSRRKVARLHAQASELLVAAPQVVAHRLGRMALSGPKPSLKDQREFQRMSAEKIAAFGEAWRRGANAAAKAKPAVDWQGAALDILGQGIRPVHRRAVANAKRLSRIKPR